MKQTVLGLLCIALLGPALAASTPTSSEASAAGAGNLTSVLRAIAERSPDVKAARAAQRQARAEAQRARAAWFGKVDVYALSQHFNDPRLTRPITQPPDVANYPFSSAQFGYGLDLRVPIDLSRQIAAEVDAARNRAKSVLWSTEDLRLRSLLKGATLYRTLEALAGQDAALAKQLESLRASERVAETGLKVGNIARVSLLRVQAAVAEVQADIAKIAGQEQKLRAQLAALMGVDSFLTSVDVLESGPTAMPTDPSTFPPSVLTAKSAVAASEAKIQAAQRAQYPQFIASGGWMNNAVQWDQQAVDTWHISLSLRINLWSGGAQRSAIEAARAASDEANQRLISAEASLRATREGAVAQWNAQERIYHAALSGLLAAQESARIEKERFRNGLGSATDLIDAEAALARAHAASASALAGWWQADDALRYAYGEPPLSYSAVP